MTPTEKIRANAELVVGQLRQASGMEDFGYNAESVAWLDGFTDRQRARPGFGGEAAGRMSQTLGSFLGECVIRCYGGEWQEQEGTWAVAFDGGHAVFPFNKVRKQFDHGAGDGGAPQVVGDEVLNPGVLARRIKRRLHVLDIAASLLIRENVLAAGCPA
jgi:hypothetical protein